MKKYFPKPVRKKSIVLPANNVPRQILKQIEPWLKRKEVIVLLGARQTGKTTILYQLMVNLLLTKKDLVYYFNLDSPYQLEFFITPDAFLNLITSKNKPLIVIIDEIQRLKNPGLFLKGIYDLNLPVKLIVSGSSSLEIKARVQEALTGRKIVFNIHPFNLEELSHALKQKKTSQEVLTHFFIFGSYPSVATETKINFKRKKLEEIFQSYLERDIKSFFQIENELAFKRLVTLLAAQTGKLVNKTEISQTLGIHLNTLDNYLFYLEQTFMINFVSPFFRNIRKEIVKSPKPYFLDLGFRNLAMRNFTDFDTRFDKGELLENFCYLELKKKLDPFTPIHFWRTKAGAEVDFVVLVQPNQPIPIEVKARKLTQPKISRSLRNFLSTYQPQKAYLLNLGLNSEKNYKETKVFFLTPKEFAKLKKLT